VLCLVVLASALERLGLYEDAYGFTRLRFAVHATILWLGVVFGLVLAAGARRGGGSWLPRGVVAVTALAGLGFALVNPDGRVAAANVERYERSGKFDLAYARRLSADAAPSLGRLPAPLAGRALAGVRRELALPEGWPGANVARTRARSVRP